MIDYARTCFVIMPFDEKEVVDDKGAKRMVNFDGIYDGIPNADLSDEGLARPGCR